MTNTFPRRFLMVVAALLAVAVYRVDSVPGPTPPYGGYTWQTAIDEVRHQVGTTVSGLREQILEAQATYDQMSDDVRTLQAQLD